MDQPACLSPDSPRAVEATINAVCEPDTVPLVVSMA
jgi:hypothetical protein